MGSPNDIVVSRLRLKTPTDCIPHTYWMYRRCLSIFTCCAWAYECTLTLLYLWRWGPNVGKPGYWEPKWLCGVMVEATNPCWLHPTSIMSVYMAFEHLHMLWMGIWPHRYTVILVVMDAKFREIGFWWGQMTLWCYGWGCKPPLTTSHIHFGHSKVCKVFEHLHMLWMGIWVHPYTVILVVIDAKLREIGLWLAQMTFWCQGRGCNSPRWLHPTSIL
jgi:hypothetical protein